MYFMKRGKRIGFFFFGSYAIHMACIRATTSKGPILLRRPSAHTQN